MERTRAVAAQTETSFTLLSVTVITAQEEDANCN
jgi:hypothetical protein